MALRPKHEPDSYFTLTSEPCYFLDSSATLRWLLSQAGGDVVRDLIGADSGFIFTALIGIPQVGRRLDIAVEEGTLTPADADARWADFTSLLGKRILVTLPTPTVIEKAVELTTPWTQGMPGTRLHVEDAIHLASALVMPVGYFGPGGAPHELDSAPGPVIRRSAPTAHFLQPAGEVWFVTADEKSGLVQVAADLGMRVFNPDSPPAGKL